MTSGRLFRTLLAATLALVFLIQFSFAFAQIPERPMLISGHVTLNGSPAPDGLTVIAKVGTEVRGTAPVQNAQYQLVVNGTNGETVSFFLNNLASTQTVQFDNVSNGGVMQLDLNFTGTVSTSITTSVTAASTTSTEIPEYGGAALIVTVMVVLTSVLMATKLPGERGRRAP